MIKSLLRRLIGSPDGGAAPKFGKRHSVPASQHRIDPSLVDERALQIRQVVIKVQHRVIVFAPGHIMIRRLIQTQPRAQDQADVVQRSQ